MEDNFLQYSNVLNEVRILENKIKNEFEVMAKNEINSAHKCNDYNERYIIMQIPFDQLNAGAFKKEKIEELLNDITAYHRLRKDQSIIENKFDSFEAVKNQNVMDVLNSGF
jgi:GTPase involved in cell partitioning and DNA repair